MEKIVNGKKIVIGLDTDPIDPRSDDNLGTMVCFHRRYNLGDSHDIDSDDFSNWDEMENFIKKEKKAIVVLPLFLYDHSGITMNTTGFSCRWDSGQVGFIYTTKSKVNECFGFKQRFSKQRIERVKKSLIAEVETYDQYLTGEVYCFKIYDENENLIDSCYGFYDEDECLKEAEFYV